MFPFDGGLNGDPIGNHSDEWEFNGPDYHKGNFEADPLYYHTRVYIQIEFETEKAYLAEDDKGKYWLPKSLLVIKNEHAYQWTKFEPKYLEEK